MGERLRVFAFAGVFLCGVLLKAEAAQQRQQSKLPANMEVSRHVLRALEKLYDKSPTFRAQCARLASAKNLLVIVRFDGMMPSRFRAFTIIERRGRDLRADVRLPHGWALIELAAHEFEHVLEQIEGLNLRKLSRMRDTGVREIEPERYETDRAQRVGRVVAEEAAGSARAPSAD